MYCLARVARDVLCYWYGGFMRRKLKRARGGRGGGGKEQGEKKKSSALFSVWTNIFLCLFSHPFIHQLFIFFLSFSLTLLPVYILFNFFFLLFYSYSIPINSDKTYDLLTLLTMYMSLFYKYIYIFYEWLYDFNSSFRLCSQVLNNL